MLKDRVLVHTNGSLHKKGIKWYCKILLFTARFKFSFFENIVWDGWGISNIEKNYRRFRQQTRHIVIYLTYWIIIFITHTPRYHKPTNQITININKIFQTIYQRTHKNTNTFAYQTIFIMPIGKEIISQASPERGCVRARAGLRCCHGCKPATQVPWT